MYSVYFAIFCDKHFYPKLLRHWTPCVITQKASFLQYRDGDRWCVEITEQAPYKFCSALFDKQSSLKHKRFPYPASMCLNLPPLCLGDVPADISGSLWRAVEDLHRAGGGRVRQGDAGQPAHGCPCWLPPGGRQTAVHCQNSGKPALH